MILIYFPVKLTSWVRCTIGPDRHGESTSLFRLGFFIWLLSLLGYLFPQLVVMETSCEAFHPWQIPSDASKSRARDRESHVKPPLISITPQSGCLPWGMLRSLPRGTRWVSDPWFLYYPLSISPKRWAPPRLPQTKSTVPRKFLRVPPWAEFSSWHPCHCGSRRPQVSMRFHRR